MRTSKRYMWNTVFLLAMGFILGMSFSEIVMDPHQAAARAQIDALPTVPVDRPAAPSVEHLLQRCESQTRALLLDVRAFRRMHPQWRKPTTRTGERK